MSYLINIDNGGTLTDVCIMEGASVWHTKTLTTPYDLSKCFYEGLRKAAATVLGDADKVRDLLKQTDHIRYSTTQGTNALVQRKGPRLGVILSKGVNPDYLQGNNHEAGLYGALVGERIMQLDADDEDALSDSELIRLVNSLAAQGANRVVVCLTGDNYIDMEKRIRKIIIRRFPGHLLGTIPVLFSHEMTQDQDEKQRAWSAVFNAFLHPAMELFLYNAENILRENHSANPLLIFRNDGDSARVAKTVALKSYSSGPRGGMEGAKAAAEHYGIKRLITMDVGGTTTDVGLVEDGEIRNKRVGEVEGVKVSFPLSDIFSAGVGGGSKIFVRDGAIQVGPESVGGAPGPACFGMGGEDATITDVLLLMGVLDPQSYFGGDLKLDVERARNAVEKNVAQPLGLSVEDAVVAMDQAWQQKAADSLTDFTSLNTDTVMAAFGGGGPMNACGVAEKAGLNKILVPRLAAVFSAFGIGFSNIGHGYEEQLTDLTQERVEALQAKLTQRLERDMYVEGFSLDQCDVITEVLLGCGEDVDVIPVADLAVVKNADADSISLRVRAVKPIASAAFGRDSVKPHEATSSETRDVVLADGQVKTVPVFRVEQQRPGAMFGGPAILEEDFFTCRVPENWRFEFTENRDIMLTREG